LSILHDPWHLKLHRQKRSGIPRGPFKKVNNVTVTISTPTKQAKLAKKIHLLVK
jgi:hypothetical protein